MRRTLRKFTPWTNWSNRKDLDLSLPGVYLLGRFTELAPPGRPDLSSNLIYIGETCGQQLRGRLYQFERSAFHDREAHSGGSIFAKEFKFNSEPSWLYLSIHPVELPEPHNSAYIRHVERALIWEYVQEHGKLPRCNRK